MSTNTTYRITSTIKRTLFALSAVALLGSASVATAQTPEAPEAEMSKLEAQQNRIDRKLKRLTKRLDLTPEQATTVGQLLEQRATQIADIKARYKGDRKAARPELKALRTEMKTKLAATLSPEQMAKFQKVHAKKRRFKKMAKHLNLTPEQKKQIRAIKKSTRLERQAILEQHGRDRAAAKPKLKELRQAKRAEIKALLTPEQVEQFKELRGKRRRG